MDWNALADTLVKNRDLIVVVTTIIGTAIAVWWFLLGGLVKVLNWFKPRPKAEIDNQTVDTIIEKLLTEQKAKIGIEQERDQLRKALEALQHQQPSPQREAALKALEASNTDEAEALFLNIAKERKAAGTTANREAAEAFRHLGALAFLHDTKKALQAYVEATGLDPDHAGGLNLLGHLQIRLGNLEAAEKSYNKVLSLGNLIADKKIIARATGNLGLIHQTRGDPDKAEEMHLKSLALNEELGSKEGMAVNYTNLGLIHKTRGDLDKAEEMLLKSFALNKELGHKEGMAANYTNLGVIHKTRGDLDKAEEMLLKSFALDKELGRKEGMAVNYSNWGVIHKTRGDLDKAEEMLLKSFALNKELGHKKGMAANYGNLGLIHQTRGDLDKAEEMFLKSLVLHEELGSKEGMADNYSNLGLIYKIRGDLDNACSHWRTSRDLYAEIGEHPQLEQVEELLNENKCPPE